MIQIIAAVFAVFFIACRTFSLTTFFHMNQSTRTTRINGLDTLRACAILLVMVYHYQVVVSKPALFGGLSEIGWVGVDLFFVLSGYLIGDQILAAMANGREFSLKTFYVRRFLRTLPNFYVVLALYFLFPLLMGGRTPPPLWRFLTFTQNWGLHTGTAFSHAWSLCIEEQFYVILPVVALLFSATGKYFAQRDNAPSCHPERRIVWIILVAVIMAGMAARGYFWANAVTNDETYYHYIYYSSLCRFDELLPGVAIALLKNYHGVLWEQLLKLGNAMLALGLLAVAILFYGFLNFHYIEGQGFGFVMTTFGYSLLAFSFALLVIAALSPYSYLHRLRIPGCASLALWSYAIYLVHKAVYFMLKAPLLAAGIGKASILSEVLMMAANVLVGWLLFLLVETPFMRLRARLHAAQPASVPRQVMDGAG